VDDAILFRAATAELFDTTEDVDVGDATAAEVPLVDFLRVGVSLFRVTAVLVVDLDVAEPTEKDGDDAPDAATADVGFGVDDDTAKDDLDLAATRASCHAFAFAFASAFASVRLFFFGIASSPLSPSVEALSSTLRFTIVAVGCRCWPAKMYIYKKRVKFRIGVSLSPHTLEDEGSGGCVGGVDVRHVVILK
jgi:hypothetical protein